jgi:hypothetical protein
MDGTLEEKRTAFRRKPYKPFSFCAQDKETITHHVRNHERLPGKVCKVIRREKRTLSDETASHCGVSPFEKAMLKIRAGSAPRLSSCIQGAEHKI